MSTELIRPNWHVILIHYPLALLGVGLVIEVFSFLWRRSTLRTAGRWMILLGAVLAIPAATSGTYAFRDVMTPGPAEPHVAWYRLVERSPWSDEQWRLMTRHVLLAAIGTGAIALSLVTWLAVSDPTRRRGHWLLVLVAVGGMGCLSAAAWYSGEAIYLHGTAIEHPGDAATQDAHAAGMSLEDVLPPMQVHVVLAGLTVSAALVALGLSIHWWGQERRRRRRDELAEQLQSPDTDMPPADSESAEAAAIVGTSPSMPFPARYWLLTLVFALGAYASGLWQAEDWKLEVFTPDSWHRETRLAWHAIGGIAVAATAFLLMLLTLLFRRWRLIGYAFGLLLVAALAAQLAMGTLILYDSTTGPLFGLRQPTATTHPTP